MSLTATWLLHPAVFCVVSFSRELRGFYRFGGDLLSHVLRRSTIGATALNVRVRDGTGCFARAMATKPGKPPLQSAPVFGVVHGQVTCWCACFFDRQSFCYWIKSSLSG